MVDFKSAEEKFNERMSLRKEGIEEAALKLKNLDGVRVVKLNQNGTYTIKLQKGGSQLIDNPEMLIDLAEQIAED